MKRVPMLLILSAQLAAQQPDPDPRALGLALLRARAELELADSAYVRTRQLFERRMVSAAELETRHAEREHAAIAVLERWAGVTAATPRLRVVRAIKSRAQDGGIVARLRIAAVGHDVIANRTPLPVPDDILDRLRAATSAEAYLSVKDETGPAGTAIGVPYEQRVRVEPTTLLQNLEFRLLRDVDAVVVSLTSGGRLDERKVWLEADVSGAVSIQPMPFSQEAEVGSDAAYDLTIESMGGGDAPLRLTLTGLPPAVAHSFTDSESGARIGQLRFATGEHQRRVRLTLSLPDAGAGMMMVDSAYRFLMVAAPERDGRTLAGYGRNAAEWRQAGAGVAELEVVPRGVGRAELRAFNLFHEASEGERVDVDVMIRNAGSRELDLVRVAAELPAGWTLTSAPGELRAVEPGADRPMRLSITPASGADLGDYEARLRIDGTSGQTRLTGDPTVIRIRVRARSGGMATLVLIAALLAGATATVILTRRLASR